jgi:hypothetical protein
MSRTRKLPRIRPSGRIIVPNDFGILLKTIDFSPISTSPIIKSIPSAARPGDELQIIHRPLDDGNDTGLECFPRASLKIEKKRLDRAAAKISQEPALELEEDPAHLRHREDDLALQDIQKKRLPHPLPPFLKPVGVTGGAKAPGLAGKHQKMFGPAARATDPGEPAARIAAVKTSLRGAKRRGNLMPFARHFEITTAFQAS